MKISISNFKRVRRASLEGGPIILVAGRNGAGKSSILSATRMAMIGDPIPQGWRKAAIGDLIHHGAKEAQVSVECDDRVARIKYPSCDVFQDGGVISSRIAVGLESICEARPADMAAMMGKLINAMPTEADVSAALDDVGVSQRTREGVLASIKEVGWDGTLERAQTRLTKLKGEWERVTRQKRWGANIARDWTPDGWTGAMIDAVHIEAKLEGLKQRAQDRAVTLGIDSAERARLAKIADGLSIHETNLANVKKTAHEAETELVRVRDSLAILPDDRDEGMPCPHCGGIIVPRRKDGVTTFEAVSDNEQMSAAGIKKARAEFASLDGKRVNLEQRIRDAGYAEARCIAAIEEAKDAQKKLEESIEAGDAEDDGRDLADQIEAETRNLAMRLQYDEARATTDAISTSIGIVEILKPEGLRSVSLGRAVADFVAKNVAPVCAASGWPQVGISPEFVITFGGERYDILGESHAWICRTILQVAMAAGQPVVIDRADVLDPQNRNKLFKMLSTMKIEAIVGMTMAKPELMPDLAKAGGVGVSFWVEDGAV